MVPSLVWSLALLIVAAAFLAVAIPLVISVAGQGLWPDTDAMARLDTLLAVGGYVLMTWVNTHEGDPESWKRYWIHDALVVVSVLVFSLLSAQGTMEGHWLNFSLIAFFACVSVRHVRAVWDLWPLGTGPWLVGWELGSVNLAGILVALGLPWIFPGVGRWNLTITLAAMVAAWLGTEALMPDGLLTTSRGRIRPYGSSSGFRGQSWGPRE